MFVVYRDLHLIFRPAGEVGHLSVGELSVKVTVRLLNKIWTVGRGTWNR